MKKYRKKSCDDFRFKPWDREIVAEKLSEEGYLLSLGIRNPGSLTGSLSSVPETQLFRHTYDAKIPQSAKSWIEGNN
ncbi:MAG: hypothetical protein CM1200mP30_26210 [Pseudomonadota bacterium]|nr:MAG: hypothetical protein CM1200mP30_26210 [Pseudomonadota bacterium]